MVGATCIAAALALTAPAATPRLAGQGWVEDAAGTLDVAGVAALPDEALRPLRGTTSAGFGLAPRWIRAELRNPGPAPADVLLVFEFPVVERLDLWLSGGPGGWEHHAGGLGLPPAARAISFESGAHVVRLTLAPGERRTAVYRVRTRGAGFLGVGIYDRAAFARRGLVLVVSGMGVGGLLLLLVLNGRFCLRRRRARDVHGWLFLALQTVHVSVAAGLVSTVAPVPPGLLASLKAISAGASTAAGLGFLAAFLETAKRRPRLAGAMRAGAALALLASALVPLAVVAGNVAVSAAALAAMAVAGLATGEALLAGHRPARVFLPGMLLFSLASGWYTLSLLALAPPVPAVVLAEIVGVAITGTLMTLAVAKQEETEEGARTERLEALVEERTGGLRQALAALQAEASERRGAEARLRLAFKTNPDALALLGDGRFLVVNDGFLRLHGRTEAEVLGRTPRELGLWVDPATGPALTERLRAQGSVREFEAEVVGEGGEPRTCLLSAGMVRDGEVNCSLVVARDVTEARAAAARRERLEEDLRQAQKLEAVGRLAAGVAHDFNNLLTAVSANVGVALEGLPPGHADREALEEALGAARRASGLTRQLLAFTRRQVAAPRPVSVDELVDGMGRLLGRVAGEDVRLVLRLDAARAPVMADPGQLEQVLLNLVLNARDAVGPGGTIEIETGRVDRGAEGSAVRLAVRDDGVGMDAETRAHIFEPFFTTKPEGRGTGLGLATVYAIVQQHRGTVLVASEPGKGSTFQILLPALAAGTWVAASTAPDGLVRGGTETILVVEDTVPVREAARTALRHLGYEVLTAAGGEEALALLRQRGGPVHLLLTDVRMPGMNGPEVAQRVRAVRPAIRVLFMTGYGGDALAGIAVDPRDIVEKPFTLEALGKRVREALAAADRLCPVSQTRA